MTSSNQQTLPILIDGWRRFFMHHYNSANFHHDPHYNETKIIKCFASAPLPATTPTKLHHKLTTATSQALPHLRHTYHHHTYDPSTLYYPTPATLAIHPQPNQNFILTTTTTPAQTIRQFITHTLHALTQSPIAYPNPIYLHYQTTPTQLFLFISFNHALIDGLEMVSFLNQFLHTTAHHNIYLTHHPPLSPLQHNHHTYYTTDLTIPDNTPPADQYHRIVYQLAHQHQARQINQLTALRLPHHKVTLTPVRYRPAWPDFRRHNHHQLNISKQTRNRYTRYFDTYHHAPHLSAALYSLLTHPHLSRYRPHVLGHLQISAVFMPTTQYILFPFAHTYQPHAIALCQRPQPHTNTLRIAGVIYQP